MTDRLKFINDVEAKAIGLTGSRIRRNLDAIDELRVENARLQRELEGVKEENQQLRERIGQVQAVPVVTTVKSPIIVEEKTALEEPLDDATVMFSLLELK